MKIVPFVVGASGAAKSAAMKGNCEILSFVVCAKAVPQDPPLATVTILSYVLTAPVGIAPTTPWQLLVDRGPYVVNARNKNTNIWHMYHIEIYSYKCTHIYT